MGPSNLCFNELHEDSDAYWSLETTGLVDVSNLLVSGANQWELCTLELILAAGFEESGPEGESEIIR